MGTGRESDFRRAGYIEQKRMRKPLCQEERQYTEKRLKRDFSIGTGQWFFDVADSDFF